MLFLGIDPGITGAYALITEQKKIVVTGLFNRQKPIPDMLRGLRGECLAALERVNTMPGEGHKGAFTFGKAVGIWVGILATLGIDYINPTPQVWQKAVYNESFRSAPDMKVLSVAYAKLWYPSLTWRKTHHNLSDALHLARFARMYHMGELDDGVTRRTIKHSFS